MTKTLVCNCNQTMSLDDAFFKKHLTGHTKIYDGLCRQEIGSFIEALDADEEIVVACTQEKALFNAIALHTEKPLLAPIRFINIRETAAWGNGAKAAQPKITSLLELAKLPPPEPLPTVNYDSSRARLLIIGGSADSIKIAQQLYNEFTVTVLLQDAVPMPFQKQFSILRADLTELSGYLGKFDAQWQSTNPIQLDLCTGCGACIAACPESAIDGSFQIDLNKCDNNRACVSACGAIGAIQFVTTAPTIKDEFDLVLDLHDQPFLKIPEPPKGYFAPGKDQDAQAKAIHQLMLSVGEFEKPKFFLYNEKICAHGRNGQVGCNACIEICSTQAIQSVFEGGKGRVSVNPHLCMGCGACATACPSGAMSYANPSVPYLGHKFKVLAQSFTLASPEKIAPTVLLHSGAEGGDLWLDGLGRMSKIASQEFRGIPAHVIPMSLHHIASTGIELWLGMLTQGVGEIALLATGEESPQYLGLLKTQIQTATEILVGLGYTARIRLIEIGTHQSIHETENLRKLDRALQDLKPMTTLAPLATFTYAKEKRQTLEMVLEHLLKHAPLPLAEQESLPLSTGALIGGVSVNTQTCTLCMSCVSACPEGALLDHLEIPQLGLIEKNCVQCGLCSSTCPENAITLQPRLSTIAARKVRNTLNEDKPFHCVKCAKPFATAKMMQNMLLKVGQHPAFAGAGQKRIQMCGDCRVLDMMQTQDFS
jgi:ferredoxin